jgi:PPIC-type PPIASE domain
MAICAPGIMACGGSSPMLAADVAGHRISSTQVTELARELPRRQTSLPIVPCVRAGHLALCQSAKTSSLKHAVTWLIMVAWLDRQATAVSRGGQARPLSGWRAAQLVTFGTGSYALRLARDELTDLEIIEAAAEARVRVSLAAFYHRNTALFLVPELRDAVSVRTLTLAAAREAKREILAGDPFAQVVRRISVDPRAKKDGGVVLNISRRQEAPPLGREVFDAKLHELVGPVRSELKYYYVFEITRIHPPKHITVARYISRHLGVGRERELRRLVNAWRTGVPASTTCRDGYVVAACGRQKLA